MVCEREMRDKLVRCLRMASRLIPPHVLPEEYPSWYSGWMCCYGGDTTCSLVSHYGDDRLASAIQEVLDSGEL